MLKKWKKIFNSKKKTQNFQKRKGLKVILAGRIRGAAKARLKKLRWGPLGTSTITKSVYYHSKPIHTKNGILGLKLFRS